MNELLSTEPEASWEGIAPHLDAALGELNDTDRDAVLLRYFQHKSAREIAQTLGTTEEAAQKRVSRGVERLRASLSKRGVAVGAGGLAVLVGSNAVHAAPAGLTAALSGAALHHAATTGLTKAIAMTTLQKSLIAATLTAAVGAGVYEAHRASELQTQVAALQQSHPPLAADSSQWLQQRDDFSNQLSSARQEIETLRSNTAELPRLRGEVARLRERERELALLKAAAAPSAPDPVLESVKSWAARASQLRQRLDQTPDQRIPELALLAEKDWLDAVKNSERLETDAEYRQAAANLRTGAKNVFGELTRKALKKYAEANGGFLPADLSQLKPYYDQPVDDAILQRYSLQQTGKLNDVPSNEFMFVENTPPVDINHDTFFQYRMNGTRTSGVASMFIERAAVQYAEANNGLLPTDPSQLAPYLKSGVDPAKVRQMLSQVPSGITTLEQLRAAGFIK